MTKTVAELVAEAKQRIDNLTVEQVAAEQQQGDALFVDLREPAERAASGTIPGSIAAPRGMLEFYADPSSSYHLDGFDPNRRVILYCAGGGRSALAGDTLRQLGYENVAHLEGGYTAWKQAGMPAESVSG